MKRFLMLISFILLLSGLDINAQQRVTVTGTVVDVKNVPLIGVAIIEKGTTNGVETNLNGVFTISVSSPNAILSVAYMGYESREVTVSQA